MTATIETLYESTQSPAMQDVLKTIERVGPTTMGVLIIGETGTGKNWIAQKVHFASGSFKRFVTIDCSGQALHEATREIFGYEVLTPGGIQVHRGALEEAAGGTLFFDEIIDLAPSLLTRIARSVERLKIRRVGGQADLGINVRIIASVTKRRTNHQPQILNNDIFYRMTPAKIILPPLRERKEDLPLLAKKFIVQANVRTGSKVRGMTDEAMQLCLSYDWPGNIREFKNALEYAIIMTQDDMIQAPHLPSYVHEGSAKPSTPETWDRTAVSVTEMERLLIERALNDASSKKQAAELLGISLKTLYNKLNKYNLYDKFVQHARKKRIDQEKKP